MGKHCVKIGALVSPLFLMVMTAPALAQESVWATGARTLPPSMDVSDELRQIPLKTPAPDVEVGRTSIPETTEQGEAMIRAADQQTAAAVRKVAQAPSVTVQHDTIAGVNVYRITPPEIAQALFLVTPGADAGKVGDARYIHEGIDAFLVPWNGIQDRTLRIYASNFKTHTHSCFTK